MYTMYMHSVSVAALRSDLARLLRGVERGAEVTVLRSGRPVAKIVPAAEGFEHLSPAGVHAPRRTGPIPKVKPLRIRLARTLTATVLEERD